MTPQSSPPFYGSSRSPSGSAPTNGSPQSMALDNIIRRELRVSDPNDPMQIAQALLTRYQDTPRAQAISQEAKGLPFLQAAPMQALVPQATTSSDSELQQAKDDVNRDLHELTTSSLLKDVTPELQGWAQAVRSAITEGTAAARFALDPRQRDKAFAIRRQLGDYARMARLVGALTPTLSVTYRKFAQSLDEVGAVILVTMGEALSNVGFNGGRFLLQAPYSELQVRRDSVIYALRNLVGATQAAYGPNDWPRGLDAYRSLFKVLEDQGQGDLRALLLENELARTMDELIQRAAHGRAEGLRALGATAQLDLERFRRLVAVGKGAVDPESPPLTSFLEALTLFGDAFDSAGGFRLMRIARPPILFYGLYGNTVLDAADQTLLNLIIQRGLLADELDCFLQCACTPDRVICQVILDKILYDVDRAIDLYALGKDTFGPPERRAAAYAYVIEHFLDTSSAGFDLDPTTQSVDKCVLSAALLTPGPPERGVLPGIRDLLRPLLSVSDPVVAAAVQDLLTFAGLVWGALNNVLGGAVIRNQIGGLNGSGGLIGVLTQDNTDLTVDLRSLTNLWAAVQQGQAVLRQTSRFGLTAPPTVQAFLEILQQELCIQRDAEERWENLVKSMAPNCFGLDGVFNVMGQFIRAALARVSGETCSPFAPTIPPQFETSLAAGVFFTGSKGEGRPPS